MLTPTHLTTALGLIIAGSPLALLAVLAGCAFFSRPLTERTTSRLTFLSISLGLLAAVAVLSLMALRGRYHLAVGLGNWVVLPHYHFHFKLLFDPLSLPFAILAFVLCGTVGAFAGRYLHREPGFHRFHVLYALFVTGMVLSALA